MATQCFLQCLNGSHDDILLEDLKPSIFGRMPHTKIKDKRCSKNQVELTANYNEYKVKYIHLGKNDGGFEGKLTKAGEMHNLGHDDKFEFLFGQYPHKIAFHPEPKQEKKENSEADFILSNNKSSASMKKKNNEFTETPSKKFISDTPKSTWISLFDGQLHVYNQHNLKGTKVAAYDMDGTLITTVSGRVFPKDINDWKILYAEVPGKLKRLSREGYKIVIFTNQLGVSKGKISLKDIQTKVTNVIEKLGIPVQALISTVKGKFRKPLPGMWDFFIEECNGGLAVDVKESIYVGDAAGRPEVPKQKKKDHSSADRLFALNIGIPFATPEEHFLGHKTAPFKMPDFLPKEIDTSAPLYNPSSTKVPKFSLEVIVLVGFPGSGKSTFVKNHLLQLGYVPANRDTLGSWQKCVALMEKSLQDGKHVVIDNTNPDRASRARYLEVAKKKNVESRCFLLNVSLSHAQHNNKFRELCESDHSKVNEMIFNSYKSKYEEPSFEEGFSDIVKVNFLPTFENAEQEKLYKLFMLEK